MPVTQNATGATMITGNAINWYRATVCRSAIRMYLAGMKASRNSTSGNLRAIASQYTGKQYARSRKGMENALADLDAFLANRDPDSVTR